MSRFQKKLLALLLITTVPIAAFFGATAFRDRSVTIGALLADHGFVEFRPPSKLVAPGQWVQITGTDPLHLSIICGSMSALGFPDDFEPLSSRSIDVAFSRSFEAEFTLAANVMKMFNTRPSLDGVERVTFSLANVRVVEVADEQVRQAILNRGVGCHEAIKARFEEKVPVTMIKSALIADVRYMIDFRQGLDETVKSTALRDLALDFDLRTDVTEASSQVLVGSELVWGVREDNSLAATGFDLPATGGPGTKEDKKVLHGLGPVMRFDDATADSDTSAAERREFPDSEILIRYDVVPRRPSSRNACWATVYAMMTAWRLGEPIEVSNAVRALGEPFIQYFVSDKGLPGGREIDFVRAAGMDALPPASYPLTSFGNFLRQYGPLWIIAGDGISSHARLLVGIYGKALVETPEAYRETVFELIDPSSGTYVYESALEFEHFFEREAVYIVERENDVDLRWQILHWPDAF